MRRDLVAAGVPYVEYDEVEAICPECGRTFRSEETLRAHQEEVHAPARPKTTTRPARSVVCSACGRRFPTTAGLSEHVKRDHTG